MELRYLYVGSADTGRDVEAWLRLPGARMRWRFRRVGADVAAIELGGTATVLLADHRPPGSILPIYAVTDLGTTVSELSRQGWLVEHRRLETPEGPAAVVRDPSGTAVALLRVDRPDAMDAAYATTGSAHAVRSDASTVTE